ncbi:MAG TPA: cupin-like domain-containing protein [Sphingomicrobium sp.]|nr:cupin-like domain-containing protein [Sphingomicrobium sp.]
MASRVEEVDPGAFSDPQSFIEAACAGEPLLLRGLCSEWTATRAAAQSWEALSDYLMRLDSGALAQAFIGPPSIAGRYYYSDDLEGFNFERADMSLTDAIGRMSSAARDPSQSSLYFGSIPADDHVPGFAEQNQLAILRPSTRPLLWIGNASFVSCHYDTFDNLACVVAGRRRFTLYPPQAIGNLYVGPIDFTMAGPPVALAAGSEPGDPRFPRFEAVRDSVVVADLEPGDVLYLPKLWWHQVEATEPLNLLVNYWWDAFALGPDAPYTTMMLAMIAIADRPPRERAAWRSFFDHYVFRPDGHPLAHLPSEKHGILGPLKENYGRIRARVMQTLRGG